MAGVAGGIEAGARRGSLHDEGHGLVAEPGVAQAVGAHYMRISVSNWSTTEDDVDRSVEAVLRVAASVSGQPGGDGRP